jgi:hypothetical protein
MCKAVYVYWLDDQITLPESVISRLGAGLSHWAADTASLTLAPGRPAELRDQGSIFGPRGEIRWWKRGNTYEALAILDEPAPGLQPQEGDWRAHTRTLLLRDLDDRGICPPFGTYPGLGTNARLRVRMCQRDGVAALVSPRSFESPVGGDD